MTQHNSNNEKLASLFDMWSQGEPLTQEQQSQLDSDPIWSERMSVYSNMQNMAESAQFDDVAVPNWNRNAAFEQYLKQPSWWQNNGLSLVAMSFSIFACVVMLFDLRMNVSEAGVTIASAGQIQQQQMEQQFAKLAEENNQQIQNRLDNFQVNQQQSTAQLVSYVLNNSRLERQEDIQDMVELIQQQRKDDFNYLTQQFNDINYNLRRAQFRNNKSYGNDDELQISE